MSSMLSTALFATHLASLSFSFSAERQNFKLTSKSYVFVWATSFMSAILPLTTDSVGSIVLQTDVNTICWIKNDRHVDYLMMLVCYYIPLYVTILYIIYMYIKIWHKSRRKFSSLYMLLLFFENYKNVFFFVDAVVPSIVQKHFRRIAMYPLVLIICTLPGNAYILKVIAIYYDRIVINSFDQA
jgi:hypothetical protein